LIEAADEGDAAALRRLLAAGTEPDASVTVRGVSGMQFQTTALVAAAGEDKLETVRLLLDAGADPSLAAGDGVTPLMQAAGNGQLEVLWLLLGRGAAADAALPSTGSTASLDEGLLSFCLPQLSFLWRISIRGTHSCDE
jgi:hypothetical protein